MNRRTVPNTVLGLASLGLLLPTACVTRKTVTSVTIVPKARRIAVTPFQGDKSAAVENEFVKRLAGAGLEVNKQPKNADAVLSGLITEYRTDRQVMVFLGNISSIGTKGQLMAVIDPVVPPSGGSLTPGGIAMKNPHVISPYASVAVTARLTDPKTGRIIWAGNYVFEGIDIPSALQAVTTVLSQSLLPALARLSVAP